MTENNRHNGPSHWRDQAAEDTMRICIAAFGVPLIIAGLVVSVAVLAGNAPGATRNGGSAAGQAAQERTHD